MGSLLSFPARLPFARFTEASEIVALRAQLAHVEQRYAMILPVVRDLALNPCADAAELSLKARSALKQARQLQ